MKNDFQIGRDSKDGNSVFFACSLIDYIARKTLNTRQDVVNALGKTRIAKIIDLADVYHSDNIDKVADDFIKDSDIKNGNFDNVKDCKYTIPTFWDIGKVYKRLILRIAEDENINFTEAVLKAYNSFVSPKIDDYNSSFYYDNPELIFRVYKTGIME